LGRAHDPGATITGTRLKPDRYWRITEPKSPWPAISPAGESGGRARAALGRRVAIFAVALLLALGLDARAQEPCIGFLERSIDAAGLKGADSVFAIDLDGDGDTDVLSASHNDHRIAWYENPGGSGADPGFELEPHTITTDALSASSVFAADLDGDGDLDVLSASRNDGTVAWYENDGGSDPRFRKRVVTSGLLTPLSVFAADVDGDGDEDVLSASFTDNKIAWFENLRDEDAGTGVLFEEHLVTTEALGAASVFAADLDGDGDTDILSASRVDDKVAWYEQELQDGEEGPEIVFLEHLLTTEADGANSVLAADLDGDQDLDVVAASTTDNTIRWFENEGGSFADARIISDTAAGARSVFAADLDGDDDLDVIAASSGDDTVAWYRNEGDDSWPRVVISSETVSADAVHAALIDDDDLVDVLSISSVAGATFTDDKLAWFRNKGPSPVEIEFEEDVIATTASGANAVAIADIDDDGAADILAARSDNPLAWYENDGAAEPGFIGREVVASAQNATTVLAVDLDGAPGIDIVAGFPLDDTIAWYQNDGETDPGPGFTEQVITTSADFVESTHAADVNGDGHADVLSASSEDDKIAWYENPGGLASDPGAGFTEHVISTEADGAKSVHAADLDGDEDIDVLSASAEDNKIAWYEQRVEIVEEEEQIVFDEHLISGLALRASFVTAADLDADGDEDVVTIHSQLGQGAITWYENRNDGAGADLSFVAVPIGAIPGLSDLRVTDVDLDGDLDLVTISSGSTRILWLESDGSSPPSFTARVVQGSAIGGRTVAAADLNGDDDIDFAAGYQAEIVWYEQLDEICAGFDANGDGVMDGVELAWLSRAFGSSSDDPGSEWWAAIDLNQDGSVDGDDLAILTSFGVWGRTPDTCSYSCP
jgi:hypothetical protein